MPSYRPIDRHDVVNGHPVEVFDRFWYSLKTDAEPVPWSAFRPMDHTKVLPWVLVLDHIEDDTYEYRITGTGCEELFKKNMTGETFGAGVKPEFISTTLSEFEALRAGADPFYYHGTIPIEDRDFIEVYRAAYGFADDEGLISKMFVVVAPVSKIVAPSAPPTPLSQAVEENG